MGSISLETRKEALSVPEGTRRYEAGALKICLRRFVGEGATGAEREGAVVYLKDKCQGIN